MNVGNPPTEVVETPFGRYETFVGDLITEQLKRFGGHQRPDLAMATSQLRSGDVVLDVGAHIGTFAIPFARAVQPGGHVYAFEPVPETLEVLRRNVEINIAPVTPVHAVVSDSNAAMRRIDIPGNTGLSFFQAAGADDSKGVAPTVVLDEFFAERRAQGRVGVVKVDVEGMELHVLRGARRLIAEHRPAIILEVNRRSLARTGSTLSSLDAFLRKHGYHLFVNLAARNVRDDRFALSPLPGLWTLRLGGGLGLIDVLAVHSDSDRYPSSTESQLRTLLLVARASGRSLVRRGRRLVRRG
jgi:FkbM family methyltransferase